ncbi:putative glycosyltransferase EpsE [Desulfosporosinus acididurans]|uniref:Putative glycosyltransferase EpsE n=1 Tax=Desulfosporosinus acididurans TaxID=476652 RepID=A0A0J1FLW0_9FIRM|nr:glycosyltransferase [Desulfosporosinus acididurans]KLU64357.1 putative glycosyltransferase EpsE [Desulfosporosinus acididurans]
MPPLVSVILPSYKHEKYVRIALESVLKQSFCDYEFLISDDCSPDNTVKEIQKYKDERIKLHIFPENQGATINHKYLIEQARGKYVALINSDDVWLPGRLEKQVDYLEEHKECGACFSWAAFIDENGNHLKMNENVFEQPNRTQAEWYAHFFQRGNCLCHPSVLIRTELYHTLGVYNLSLRQLPDFDMWIRLIKHYNIHIFQEPLVQHRRFIQSGENTSSPKITNSIRDVMESYYILTNYFKDVSDELFEEAFQKEFRKKGKLSHNELCCEKFFLMLDGKYYMPSIPLLAAINYFFEIYSLEGMAETFKDSYHFTMQDFHDISCKVDLLGILPKGVVVDKSNDFDLETYVKVNKAKALAMIFLNRNSNLYQYCKKLYYKMKK